MSAIVTAARHARDLYLYTPTGQLVIGDLDPAYATRLEKAINRTPPPGASEAPAADVEDLDDEVKVIAICIAALSGLDTVARNRVADYIVNRCAGMA